MGFNSAFKGLNYSENDVYFSQLLVLSVTSEQPTAPARF